MDNETGTQGVLPIDVPAATPEPVAPAPADTQAPEGEKTEADAKSFTQAELDAIVQKEKAKAEAKAERRSLRAYKETLERLIPQQREQIQQQQPDAGRPTQAQFANVDDYVEAMAEWKLGQRDQATHQQRQQEQQRALTTRTEKLYAQAASEPGFDRQAFDELPLTQAIAAAVTDSDVAPKLMAFMAANPDEVERIARLSPARQAAEIGKLETRVSSAPKVSNAPAPIKPIGARGSGSTGDLSKSSMDDYIAERKKQGATWARG